MKRSFLSRWFGRAAILAALLPWAATAQDTKSAAGHWEGAITLPNIALAIRVDLEGPAAGRWTGSIDIPVQGLRAFALSDVSASGAAVKFKMPGIPGEPSFEGKLNAAGSQIAGDFRQHGQTYPLKIERKAKPKDAAGQTPAKGIPGQGLAGLWQGTLKAGAAELRLGLKVTQEGGKLTATMDSIDQGAMNLKVDSITDDEGAVKFELRQIKGDFEGTMSKDGSEIAGNWKQGGQVFPLVFKRVEKTARLNRPQEPQKPFPYDEEEVVVENTEQGVSLAGTLTLPRGSGKLPAALLITGSGPQDRDELVMGHKPFLVLADHLSRRGIAVLRVDDRGVAKSTGKYGEATTDEFVSDAIACAAFLRRHPRIDPERVGLIGHSEGGVTGPLAALKAPGTAFLVLLAAPGVPMRELLARQGRDIMKVMGAAPAKMLEVEQAQERSFDVLREEPDNAAAREKLLALSQKELGKYTEEEKAALGLNETAITAQIDMILTPWFRKLLAYDPRPALERTTIPVLALAGEKDIQVAARENLEAIRLALEKAGNKDFKTAELPGLNHLFQHCETGALAEYSTIEETFAPEALDLVSGWIRERFAKKD